MTEDLLTSFRSEVRPPHEARSREVYTYATSVRRGLPKRRLVVLVAAGICAAVAALALVPVGGASLGARAVHSLTNLWGTPANQPALDRAADDAASIASGYYTDARVNDGANKVDVYLTDPPQSVIDQLQAKHPGIYAIHTGSAHTLSELLKVEHSLNLVSLQSQGIEVVSAYPSSDGYLKVGVRNESDVQAAQSALDSMFGPGIIKVYGGAEPGVITPDIVTVHGSSNAKHQSGAADG
jgi:hypothetical protein